MMATKILFGLFGVGLVVAVVGVAYPELLGLNRVPIEEFKPPASAAKATPEAAKKTSGCGADGNCCCAAQKKVCCCSGGSEPAPGTATAAAIGLAASPQGALVAPVAAGK